MSSSDPTTAAATGLASGAAPVRIVYRTLAVLLIGWGVLRVTGAGTAHWTPSALLYYTVLSNLLCLGWMLLSLARSLRGTSAAQRATPSARWAAAVMMAITVTMLIYLVVLAPAAFSQPGTYEPFTLTDNLVHIVTPLLVIVDWLVFVPRGHLRWFDPLLWPAIPYVYLAFAFLYGALGGAFGNGATYPYLFMDVGRWGVGGVVLWTLGLTVALEAVAFASLGIDRLLARVGAPRRARRAATL
ncbi:Pr6Pr family membrane protein [Brachybacterium sp. YJGR34]|uniref:Pr6Pr family membrane protein n=1 Tax=Brachybacterium sp. YJGR34 TaxID=2059911 RepID=UPI000E0C26DA|nr:Pr6Pr family membrane protein [Brachybacterium sp. YJGR34]